MSQLSGAMNRWPSALIIAVVGFLVTWAVFTHLDRTVLLLLCLLAYVGAKFGIAFLTSRRGGWHSPAGFFIVWYSLSWIVYVAYVVQLTYLGHVLQVHIREALYASMFVSAICAIATYPWRDPNPTDKRSQALDERSAEQDRRGLQLDRRGAGQDERAKLLTKRTIGIDTRSDEIGRREGAQNARDEETTR